MGGRETPAHEFWGVTCLYGNNLGSTSATTDASSRGHRYYPFGQTRGRGTILAGLLSVSLQIGDLHAIAQGRECARKNLT